MFDRAGSQVDSVPIATMVNWKCRAYENMVLVSSWGYPRRETKEKVGNRFFCYDFGERSLKFFLEDTTYRFGDFDADVQNGLVAVVIQPELKPEDWLTRKVPAVVRICDLEGEYKGEIPVEVPVNLDDFWIKLLDGGILIPEGDKLRLYETPKG